MHAIATAVGNGKTYTTRAWENGSLGVVKVIQVHHRYFIDSSLNSQISFEFLAINIAKKSLDYQFCLNFWPLILIIIRPNIHPHLATRCNCSLIEVVTQGDLVRSLHERLETLEHRREVADLANSFESTWMSKMHYRIQWCVF